MEAARHDRPVHTSVTVPADLKARAQRLGINMSALLRDALAVEVARRERLEAADRIAAARAAGDIVVEVAR